MPSIFKSLLFQTRISLWFSHYEIWAGKNSYYVPDTFLDIYKKTNRGETSKEIDGMLDIYIRRGLIDHEDDNDEEEGEERIGKK